MAALCRKAEGGRLVLTYAELFDLPDEPMLRFTESDDKAAGPRTLTIELQPEPKEEQE